MGRFDVFWEGLGGIFAGSVLLAVCMSQAFLGWIGDALWLRLVYGAAGLLLGMPLIVVGIMWVCMGLTGDVDNRPSPSRIFRRK